VYDFHRVFNLRACLGVNRNRQPAFRRWNFQPRRPHVRQIKRGQTCRGGLNADFLCGFRRIHFPGHKVCTAIHVPEKSIFKARIFGF
jgi:hypothetical protein